MKIYQGGLMRCCLATLDQFAIANGGYDMHEGFVLPCKHCSSSMIVKDGAWRWNHET